MDEKIIIKSEHYNIKRYLKIALIIGIALVLLGFLAYLFNLNGCRFQESLITSGKYYRYSLISNMSDPFSLEAGMFLDLGIIFVLISVLVRWWLSSYELTITDKRIYGKTSFGKRVDLPVDSISAVGTSMLKGISVATASGKIVFKLIKNRDDIHSEISNLIITRQAKSSDNVSKVPTPTVATDEIRKYKELFDIGAITQEEFDAKKKELLGL